MFGDPDSIGYDPDTVRAFPGSVRRSLSPVWGSLWHPSPRDGIRFRAVVVLPAAILIPTGSILIPTGPS